MLLMLLRHADAAPHAARDRDRPLTDKGVAQSERVGRFCAKREILPELILTSPYRRSVETASLVAKHLSVEVREVAALGCGMTPAVALDLVREHARFGSLMLVGHQPDLGDLAGRLLGGVGGDLVRVRKASLAGFEIDPERPAGAVLQFMVPASLM
jgi:phosphohistidine phosphatase